jgi:hypothetical protein
VTPYTVVVGYQSFRGPELHPKDGGSLDIWKRWYPTTTLYGVTAPKTSTWNITAVKAWKLAWNRHELWSGIWKEDLFIAFKVLFRNLHRVAVEIQGVGIAQRYSAGLRAWWSGVRVPAGAGNFSLHHRVQTGSGTYSASCPMGTRGSFPVGKTAGTWSWPLTSI